MSSQPGTNCTVVMCEWVQRHAFRFRSRIRSPIELSSKQSSHEVEQFVHRSCPEGPKTLSSLVFLPLEDLLLLRISQEVGRVDGVVELVVQSSTHSVRVWASVNRAKQDSSMLILAWLSIFPIKLSALDTTAILRQQTLLM
ncbi:hypothetical protein M747DRAFT_83270 [Aspergillus niger ATCC 13496]|uniref:Uncharacterized protein n=1 Tax=Aspergillus niger ATCC 13496 TaxID=1353008 RepID=A0A370BXJ3_ASPNG|nr:hypothetical protein M747DRAFT_83270 [Aspergillus niger ATCC 13496]